ncbi:hypothetical protein KIN20_031518 [Parelaphostrongylus tenuis]|uniref:Secreted protein n=1 Tax=Parelaphostrongylus tenuis TaxID=148309 RepID=A0AAD5R6U2_PARTN|nr:hypothetical protein KIN20_031518 [Parelaphostrongylus tenuis]
MNIFTNKAGPSSAPFMILLLVSISTVFGCGVIPGGQTSTRTFTASRPSNLPIIAALAQRFAMQTVIDVLEIEGRRALLPDFVISNILGQLQVNTTYEPLECEMLMRPEDPAAIDGCIFVGSTVTGICPMAGQRAVPPITCVKVAMPINTEHLSLSGSLTTTNIIMANWSRSMWQNVVVRALRMLRSGPFDSHLYTVTVIVS